MVEKNTDGQNGEWDKKLMAKTSKREKNVERTKRQMVNNDKRT